MTDDLAEWGSDDPVLLSVNWLDPLVISGVCPFFCCFQISDAEWWSEWQRALPPPWPWLSAAQTEWTDHEQQWIHFSRLEHRGLLSERRLVECGPRLIQTFPHLPMLPHSALHTTLQRWELQWPPLRPTMCDRCRFTVSRDRIQRLTWLFTSFPLHTLIW